ncbi:MAG: polysaccharide biosynthesis C-terminal domain-containing protein [Bacteroidia bacterium]|nr:polysaccharide biosynthesis C-terminal domain-containing protein [Bacteroidia bacterium]
MGIVARQGFKAAISNYLGVLLGFLNLFFLFPKFFEPTELGAIRLLLEAGAVISSFALLGTNYSINRFFPYFRTDDQKHNGFFFWAFMMPLVGYTIVFIALVFFKAELLSAFKYDKLILTGLYPMLLALVFFSLFQTVLETANANHGRIAVPNFLREVVLRIIILGAGTLFYFDIIDFITTVWLMVGAYGLIVIINFFYLRTLTLIHLKPSFEFFTNNPDLKRDMIKFTAWLFLGGITGLVVSKIDFLMISAQKNLANTAIYSIGFYLALLIEIPKRTILQISAPIIANHMKNNDLEKVNSMYKQLALNQLLAASILFFAIWLNIDNLFQVMPNGDYYKAGKMVVFIIGIGRLIDMVGSTAGPVMANSKYYAWGLINFVIAIVVAVIANYFMIPIFGINGAAGATVITFLLSQGMAIYIIYKKMGLHPFEKRQWYILLILALFLIPTIWGKWLTNPYLDGMVRTIVLLGPMLYILYKVKISTEFNQAADKVVQGIRQRLKV